MVQLLKLTTGSSSVKSRDFTRCLGLQELTMTKVEMIKKAIKSKTYDLEAAIKGAVEKILEYPESLLWR